MPGQDTIQYANRMTLNSIMQKVDHIRSFQDSPLTPFPFNHPCKRDTTLLQFDEGHYLGKALKELEKALDCYRDRYQIHIANPTGEHEVIGVRQIAEQRKWNRWSDRPDVREGRQEQQGQEYYDSNGRMRSMEKK